MGAVSFLLKNTSREGKFSILVLAAGGFLSAALLSRYDARGQWYAGNGAGMSVLGWSMGAAVAVAFIMGEVVSESHQRRLWKTIAASLALPVCLVMVVVRWYLPAPPLRVSRVVHAVHPREVEQPKPKPPPPPPHSRDDQRLEALGDESIRIDVTLVVRREWDDPDKHARAREHVLERATALVDDAWTRRDERALAQLMTDIEGFDEDLTTDCHRRGMLVAGEGCLERGELDCVGEAVAFFATDPPPELDEDQSEVLTRLREAVADVEAE